MKVRELRDILSEFDQDAEVLVDAFPLSSSLSSPVQIVDVNYDVVDDGDVVMLTLEEVD